MARLAITLACGDYDRTRALAAGRVTVEGADLTVLALGPEEIFFRMARFEEFDVAELSLSTYVLTGQQDAPFVAIPVFPSRAFRHSGIYVHAEAGVDSPPDLVGRRVGVAEYQLTANGLNPANRMVLSTFLRYAREQGLARDGIEPDDLFAPETRDALAI
jgi:4,5-dihydroxyphthalate decarboxylase